MDAAQLLVSDDHPLALELVSLRTAVARYQHEAHAASVKLQRHSLETTHALERAHVLERENAHLKEEVAVLRTTPDITPSSASHQVQELTLALRRLSDKLSSTEQALLARTNELVHAQSDLSKARHEVESAHDLTARAHAQVEDGKAKARVLEQKLRTAEEERKLADLVVQEYADLVRTLEGRPRKSSVSSLASRNGANGSSTTLVDSLAEGKSGLQKLLEEFNSETERLGMEISILHREITQLSSQLEAERQRAESDRTLLAQSMVDLEKYRMDDSTAAKMVSRYMKFSQSSTDSLQKAMDNLKMRHVATTTTLSTEIHRLQKSLMFQERQSDKLRQALDELTEDISREAYGRRREIALRLAFLGREESLAEGLRRWIRKTKESFDRAAFGKECLGIDSTIRTVFDRMTWDAESLLESLNGQPALEENSVGSVARVIAAQDAVSTLTRELQNETDRRLAMARRLAQFHVGDELTNSTMEGPSSAPASPRPLPPNRKVHEVFSTPDGTSIHGAMVSLTQPLSTASQKDGQVDENRNADAITPQPEIVVPKVESFVTEDGTDTTVTVPDTLISVGVNDDHTSTDPVAVGDESAETSKKSVTYSGIGHVSVQEVDASASASLSATEAVLSSARVAPADTTPVPFPVSPDPGRMVNDHHFPTCPASSSMTDVPDVTVTEMMSSSLAEVQDDECILQSTKQMPSEEMDVFSSPELSAVQPATAVLQLTSQLMESELQRSGPALEITSLMSKLVNVQHRYDDLQRGFRDCHLALKELKKDLFSSTHLSDTSLVVQRAVERLDDFNEDVRVELEIRITDEARITSGYRTLLSVPGAITDEVDETEMNTQIRAFVDGTDTAVVKATQQFTRKLDDLEHDIASIKRTLHELSTSTSPEESQPATASPTKTLPTWSSWTAGLLSPSRPVSPAPTFGSVMTSPRLRHSASFTHTRKPLEDVATPGQDPFASLGLRIPMPSHILPITPATRPRTPRPRVSSATYMLGLGARSHSFGWNTISTKSPPVSRLASESHVPASSAEERGEDLDSDVE
ncbi:hypothetical protein AcW1_006144 [Taiwanofungus camphoratus]|nr:hypothetical protein AcW1_006144 [Antrodia cinnamomea]